jgi:hypothetical protein
MPLAASVAGTVAWARKREIMAEKGPRRLSDGAEVRKELLAEEQRVERDGFSQGHADDGLD